MWLLVSECTQLAAIQSLKDLGYSDEDVLEAIEVITLSISQMVLLKLSVHLRKTCGRLCQSKDALTLVEEDPLEKVFSLDILSQSA